ncbi:MAG: class I SAM-dependent methyltransferase, partial [Proteobacteria bacterium]|nr:class I SAM-dependent methyltransferase [Pseudomonadota bacterium]
MMEIEQAVAQHYAHGSLEESILNALAAAGKDVNRLTPKDLAPVDEFHVGGRLATVAFAEQFALRPGMRLLDIGCGIGGAARYFASEHGCQVTGIDLSAEYAAVANALAARVGLSERVSCRQGSALALPFEPGSFDGAYMFHVGMNIEDKAKLFREVRRVLTPAGVFGIYDVMRLAAGDLHYPVPWTGSADVSFVEDAASYRKLLAAEGFEVVKERSRRDFALEVFAQMRAKGAAGGPPPLG